MLLTSYCIVYNGVTLFRETNTIPYTKFRKYKGTILLIFCYVFSEEASVQPGAEQHEPDGGQRTHQAGGPQRIF